MERFDSRIEVPFWRSKVGGAKVHRCAEANFWSCSLRNQFAE
jgi:hypothetical protein